MPITVPTPEPEVSYQPSPTQRSQVLATPETFGAMPQATAEMRQLGQQTGEIVAFEKLRADQTAIQDFTQKASGLSTAIWDDPQTGFKTKLGKNALLPGAPEEAIKRWKDGISEYMNDLHGDIQRGGATRVAVNMGDSLNRLIQAHMAKQRESYEDQTINSLIIKEQDAAANQYGDAERIKLAQERIRIGLAQYGASRGMPDGWVDDKTSEAISSLHHKVISQMLDDGQDKMAKTYFSDNKMDLVPEMRTQAQKLLEVVPRQQEAEQKRAQEEAYKSHMRQAMIDMFDGKLTLSEAQRRYRADQISKSDYDILQGRLSKPDAGATQSFLVSKPDVFNEIRRAQLNGSKDPGEIQRMIAQGAAKKDITPDDGKYLLSLNSEKPPTPRDRAIEGGANNLRDFGSRYFAEKNFFGMPTDHEKTNQETESLVSDYYARVDKTKAQGDDIDKLRDEIKKTAMQKRFPGLGNYDKAPDIVIDVKGKVTRLLNPDQHSGLKPKYRIMPVGTSDKEDE